MHDFFFYTKYSKTVLDKIFWTFFSMAHDDLFFKKMKNQNSRNHLWKRNNSAVARALKIQLLRARAHNSAATLAILVILKNFTSNWKKKDFGSQIFFLAK